MNFIIRWLVTAVAVGVAVWIVPGIELLGGTDAWVGIAIFGLILSLINISIKPIMQLLSLPISVITLMGRLSSCMIGLMLMLISDRMRPKMAMPTHASVPPRSSMPGTIHTATPTATAVTSQRMIKFMTCSLTLCDICTGLYHSRAYAKVFGHRAVN